MKAVQRRELAAWMQERFKVNVRRSCRLALLGAKMVRPFQRLIPDARVRAMVAMAPKQVPFC